MFQRIVVPLDGSALAERALPQAEQLAQLAGAPLHVVRVVDLARLADHGSLAFGFAPAALRRALRREERAARDYVERLKQDLTGRGFTASGELRHGGAERELVAATQPGDLIVIATHARGGMARWFLGSVAEEVERRSPVPVMLVRAELPATSAMKPTQSR